MWETEICGPKDETNISILRSDVESKTRRTQYTMVCRIHMFVRSLGPKTKCIWPVSLFLMFLGRRMFMFQLSGFYCVSLLS